MTPNGLDHLFVAFLTLGVPWLAIRAYRHLRRSLARHPSRARKAQYQRTIAWQALTAATVLLLWLGSGRALEGLGLQVHAPDTGWNWAGWIVSALGALLLVVQVLALRSESQMAQVRSQLEGVSELLPRTQVEMQWFLALSLAAGVCEELVYRGYVIAYLSTWGGNAFALVGSSILFGLGHTYQGPKSSLRTAILGLVAGGLYLSTESLLAPMVLHTLLDVTSGIIARRALASRESKHIPQVDSGIV